jgi:hypothetical protein
MCLSSVVTPQRSEEAKGTSSRTAQAVPGRLAANATVVRVPVLSVHMTSTLLTDSTALTCWTLVRRIVA